MPPLSHNASQHETLDPAVLRDDTTFAIWRIAFFQYAVVAVFLFILSGFWTLQVQDNLIYSEAADRNRIKSTPMLAARGKILDRDGRVIVDNHFVAGKLEGRAFADDYGGFEFRSGGSAGSFGSLEVGAEISGDRN